MSHRLWLALLLASGCGHSEGGPQPIVSLAIAPQPLLLHEFTAQQLSVTATYGDGTTGDVTGEATWISSDPAAATVAAGGLATAGGVGATTIRAAVGMTTTTDTVMVTRAFDDGMVSITFDDAKASQMQAAAAMSQRGVRGTFYIVTAWVKEALAGCMNLDDVRRLAADGHEIGSHTVYHPHLSAVTDDRVAFELSASRDWLQENVGPSAAQSFATPFGEYDWRVLANSWKLYASHRTTLPHYNYPDTNRAGLGVFGTPTFDEAQQLVDRALSEHSWLIISFHEIAGSPGSSGYPLEDLEAILDDLKRKNVRVLTVAESLRQMEGPPPPPVLDLTTPSTGATTGGTEVTLAGSGFVQGAAVHFGDAPGIVTSASATGIVVSAPVHDAGVVDVVVSNPDGQATVQPSAFLFTAPSP